MVIKDNVYWAYMISIFNALIIGLYELLELTPIIVLILFFCNWVTLLVSVELPENTMPYFNIKRMHNKSFLIVSMLLKL
jgi:formate hydrogenlyase subunit 4